jgi:hypothetical protein
LSLLPAGANALLRIESGDRGGVVAAAVRLAVAADERTACLGPLFHRADRLVVAFRVGDADPSVGLLLVGDLEEREVEACAEALAGALAARAPAEGSAPPVVLGDAGGRPAFLVALDRGIADEPRGVTGPLAAAYSRLADAPVALAAAGGDAMGRLFRAVPAYLPLSTLGDAAGRIAAVGYSLDPREDGSASVRLSLVALDGETASSVARHVDRVGRLVGLPSEGAGWEGASGVVEDVSVARPGGGRRVEVTARLTQAGLRSLVGAAAKNTQPTGINTQTEPIPRPDPGEAGAVLR